MSRYGFDKQEETASLQRSCKLKTRSVSDVSWRGEPRPLTATVGVGTRPEEAGTMGSFIRKPCVSGQRR